MTDKYDNQRTTRTNELIAPDTSLLLEEVSFSACGCCSNISMMPPKEMERFLNEIKEEQDAGMDVSSLKQ